MELMKIDAAIAALTRTFSNYGTRLPSRNGVLLDMTNREDIRKLLDSHPYRGSRIGEATGIEWLAITGYIQDAAVSSKSSAIVDITGLSMQRIVMAIRPLLLTLNYKDLGEAASEFIIGANNHDGRGLGHRFVDGFNAVDEAYNKQAMQAYIEEWLSTLRKVCPREEVEDCDYALIMMQDHPAFRDSLVDHMIRFVEYTFENLLQHCDPIY
jgi:hypothetical protein